MEIKVERDILDANNTVAAENRRHFAEKKSFAINIMSSPGAGKTTLLEKTIDLLRDRMKIGVIEGDIAGSFDADRIRQHGVCAIQINTAGSCHLDARMVASGLKEIEGSDFDLLIIENVGNLVCPADFDLGENLKVALLSTTEGDDKPLKYPGMFLACQVLVINKTDLAPYTECNLDLLTERALSINPHLQVFYTSCRTDQGLEKWADFLYEKVRNCNGRLE